MTMPTSTLACAATATTLRLHLWFSSRVQPSQLAAARRRTRRWARVCDAAVAAILLAGTAAMAVDHQATAALFVTIAIGLGLASFVIEPATTRAAFGL